MEIISIDAGNGSTTGVRVDNGTIRKTTFPSVRATSSGTSLNIGDLEEVPNYVIWGGTKYVYGDGVIDIGSGVVERHMDLERTGNELHQFLLAVATGNLGIMNQDVHLITYAPPAVYKIATENINRWLMDKKRNRVKIQFKNDSVPREWEYTKTTIIPEGVAAAMCFVIDDNGSPINTNILDGYTLVLDIGVYTLDAILLKNGKFVSETLDRATHINSGINEFIRKPLLIDIKENPILHGMTIDHVDLMIRNGIRTGNYIIEYGNITINCEKAIKSLSQLYCDFISNKVIDSDFSGARNIKNILVVGGGAHFVSGRLEEMYPDKVVNYKDTPGVSNLNPIEFNAIGGLRYAIMKSNGSEE